VRALSDVTTNTLTHLNFVRLDCEDSEGDQEVNKR
jgi:hypothetical protein